MLRYLAYALNEEYKFRYGKSHKSFDLIMSLHEPDIPSIGITKPAQAMPIYCKGRDPVQAYRNYYMWEKQHLTSWRGRGIPRWFIKTNKITKKYKG